MIYDEVCAELKNYFTYEGDKHIGDFSIKDGIIVPPLPVSAPRLIRIVGSAYNDGVHYSDEIFVDEDFHGGIWIMSPPPAFFEVCEDIKAWKTKYSDAETSPFNSESFGGYSYSKDSDKAGWKTAFASRLDMYRKARI